MGAGMSKKNTQEHLVGSELRHQLNLEREGGGGYTEETKRRVVTYLRNRNLSFKRGSEELGVATSTLSAWDRKVKRVGRKPSSTGKKKSYIPEGVKGVSFNIAIEMADQVLAKIAELNEYFEDDGERERPISMREMCIVGLRKVLEMSDGDLFVEIMGERMLAAQEKMKKRIERIQKNLDMEG